MKGATYRNDSKTATLPRQKLTKAGNQMLTAQPTGSATGGRVSVSLFSSEASASFRQLCFSEWLRSPNCLYILKEEGAYCYLVSFGDFLSLKELPHWRECFNLEETATGHYNNH